MDSTLFVAEWCGAYVVHQGNYASPEGNPRIGNSSVNGCSVRPQPGIGPSKVSGVLGVQNSYHHNVSPHA